MTKLQKVTSEVSRESEESLASAIEPETSLSSGCNCGTTSPWHDVACPMNDDCSKLVFIPPESMYSTGRTGYCKRVRGHDGECMTRKQMEELAYMQLAPCDRSRTTLDAQGVITRWDCTRVLGHDGPCALVPSVPNLKQSNDGEEF